MEPLWKMEGAYALCLFHVIIEDEVHISDEKIKFNFLVSFIYYVFNCINN